VDYTYKVGDKVLLYPIADSKYNFEQDRGREVTIIDIDWSDSYLPYKIQTVRGNWYWTSLQAIKGKFNGIGLII
jgi:hypothetical protein